MAPLTIQVTASEMLKKLEENRTKHAEEYERQIAGYWKEYRDQLEERMVEISVLTDKTRYDPLIGKSPDMLPFPVSFLKDYDVVISMITQALAIDPAAKIDLDQAQYRQLWMDDWGWKNQFTSNSASYSGR